MRRMTLSRDTGIAGLIELGGGGLCFVIFVYKCGVLVIGEKKGCWDHLLARRGESLSLHTTCDRR